MVYVRTEVTMHIHALYSSPRIIRVKKSRKMQWVGHLPCTGERRGACRVLEEKPEGKETTWKTQD
jgi:hypothetical protein